jgi:iron-sulfur cluster repair protein YtfE (RIC family)
MNVRAYDDETSHGSCYWLSAELSNLSGHCRKDGPRNQALSTLYGIDFLCAGEYNTERAALGAGLQGDDGQLLINRYSSIIFCASTEPGMSATMIRESSTCYMI